MILNVFDESMKVVGADRKKMDIIQMDPEEGAAALVSGDHGGQEVPHLDFHLFGGERVGKMVE